MSTLGHNYDWAFPVIERDLGLDAISFIAEVGSRDALDSINISKHFNAEGVVFEPDPRNAMRCRTNLEAHNGKKLDLFELALSDSNGRTRFFSVDPNLYPNTGASSLYEINFKNRKRMTLIEIALRFRKKLW